MLNVLHSAICSIRMRLELLANEILLDLFEYLNTSDLFHAFYNLNYRFKQLLRTHIRFYSLDFRSISKDCFDIICEQYLPSTIDQITSLYLSDDDETPGQPKLFLSHYFTLNQFQQLQSLSLCAIYSWNMLNEIILQCRDLQYLTHLNIINSNCTEGRDSLIDSIWSLSKLTHCYLSHISKFGSWFNSISINLSSMQYFTINSSYLYSNILFSIFEHTPNLRYLSFDGHDYKQLNVLSPVMASSLITFEYAIRENKQRLIILFQNMPNLSNLKLEIFEINWNGYDWENLLTNHLPNIKLFQFKMNFKFLRDIKIENQINELLDSFQTPFWLDKHRWFVRCHWFPFAEQMMKIEYNIIYTLPYAFKEFDHIRKYCIKSTCPNEEDYYTYNFVQTIPRNGRTNDINQDIAPFQFSNLHQCPMSIFLNDKFHTYNPSLSKLTTLFIASSPFKQSDYKDLQTLVHKAPQLSSLIFFDSSIALTDILQLTNTSIHLLDFSYSYNSNGIFFNHIDCVDLVNSSLGHQCKYLLINVENRADVLYLIKNMSNLRSLIVRCQCKPLLTREDTLYQWLCDNLPSTYVITQYRRHSSLYVRLWIPNLMQQLKEYSSSLEIFKNCCLFTKCCYNRSVS